jgi:hypothetical protein
MTENHVSSKPMKKRIESRLNTGHIKNQPKTKETSDTAVKKVKQTKSHIGRAGTG